MMETPFTGCGKTSARAGFWEGTSFSRAVRALKMSFVPEVAFDVRASFAATC